MTSEGRDKAGDAEEENRRSCSGEPTHGENYTGTGCASPKTAGVEDTVSSCLLTVTAYQSINQSISQFVHQSKHLHIAPHAASESKGLALRNPK